TPNITPHKFFLSKNKGLTRFPYFWEDDIEMYSPTPSFSLSDPKYHMSGLKIFNFHPIHIVLNSSDIANYYACKSTVDLNSASLSSLEKFISSSPGTGTFFDEFIHFIKNKLKSNGLTITDLAQKYGV
ncbi:MAG: hypothetical protein ACP5IG_04865, partial [Candidatus Micrarchaeia archaeon]